MGVGGWPLPTTHTWEDAPGHHGSQKRNALGLGDGKLKHIPTGHPRRLPCISGLGCRKGMGEFVPDPESSSSLPTPRSVVVGLLLAISQHCSRPSWFSCFPPRQDPEPTEVTQGQDEANTSQSISPSSYSRSCCSYQDFRRGFSLLWHQHPVKSPFLGCMGPLMRRSHRCGLVSWESKCVEGQASCGF